MSEGEYKHAGFCISMLPWSQISIEGPFFPCGRPCSKHCPLLFKVNELFLTRMYFSLFINGGVFSYYHRITRCSCPLWRESYDVYVYQLLNFSFYHEAILYCVADGIDSTLSCLFYRLWSIISALVLYQIMFHYFFEQVFNSFFWERVLPPVVSHEGWILYLLSVVSNIARSCWVLLFVVVFPRVDHCHFYFVVAIP